MVTGSLFEAGLTRELLDCRGVAGLIDSGEQYGHWSGSKERTWLRVFSLGGVELRSGLGKQGIGS